MKKFLPFLLILILILASSTFVFADGSGSTLYYAASFNNTTAVYRLIDLIYNSGVNVNSDNVAALVNHYSLRLSSAALDSLNSGTITQSLVDSVNYITQNTASVFTNPGLSDSEVSMYLVSQNSISQIKSNWNPDDENLNYKGYITFNISGSGNSCTLSLRSRSIDHDIAGDLITKSNVSNPLSPCYLAYVYNSNLNYIYPVALFQYAHMTDLSRIEIFTPAELGSSVSIDYDYEFFYPLWVSINGSTYGSKGSEVVLTKSSRTLSVNHSFDDYDFSSDVSITTASNTGIENYIMSVSNGWSYSPGSSGGGGSDPVDPTPTDPDPDDPPVVDPGNTSMDAMLSVIEYCFTNIFNLLSTAPFMYFIGILFVAFIVRIFILLLGGRSKI